jgi:transcriptional regulator with XRE-family HTH domain
MAKESIEVRFGRACRKLRESRTGLSQEAFARECGLDRTYISSVERGKRNVLLRNVERIAVTLGVTLAQLFGEVER